jgi:hypothetical protein
VLVLPQDGQEAAVRDNTTGEPVSDASEGRAIRHDQVAATLRHIGVRGLPTEFLNVRDERDAAGVRNRILELLAQMRMAYETQILDLVVTVTRLVANRANEEMRATFDAATRPVRTWFTQHRALPTKKPEVEAALLEEMDGLRYASTLRASVNRRGSWHNFDYWHGLGFGTRREIVSRTGEQLAVVRGLIDLALNDADLSDAHDFLRHFRKQLDTGVAAFFQEVQSLGETAFFEQLREDQSYWDRCRARWGGGQGYKVDIREWTDEWFEHANRAERYGFVEQEIGRRWENMMDNLAEQLSAAQTPDKVATTAS